MNETIKMGIDATAQVDSSLRFPKEFAEISASKIGIGISNLFTTAKLPREDELELDCFKSIVWESRDAVEQQREMNFVEFGLRSKKL